MKLQVQFSSREQLMHSTEARFFPNHELQIVMTFCPHFGNGLIGSVNYTVC